MLRGGGGWQMELDGRRPWRSRSSGPAPWPSYSSSRWRDDSIREIRAAEEGSHVGYCDATARSAWSVSAATRQGARATELCGCMARGPSGRATRRHGEEATRVQIDGEVSPPRLLHRADPCARGDENCSTGGVGAPLSARTRRGQRGAFGCPAKVGV
jgi:hypothetical protein